MSSIRKDTHQAESSFRSPREINLRVTRVRQRWTARPHLWRPPTDVYETESAYVVRVEIAGMQNAELNISLEGRMMAIHGERGLQGERAAYHLMEVRFGEFLSLVELPGEADASQVNATYDDGFLLVTIPKVGI
jgi:HSP20 family protein